MRIHIGPKLFKQTTPRLMALRSRSDILNCPVKFYIEVFKELIFARSDNGSGFIFSMMIDFIEQCSAHAHDLKVKVTDF